LRKAGLTEAELGWFVDQPCPPDLIGCNYYVTSERYLDEALAAWPPSSHGGNAMHRYADVEAVRACGLIGIECLLRDVHARFGLPIAITEAHLGCSREQQMRWLVDLHDGATRARAAGVPVRAVTAWSLFGSFNWHSLVTRDDDVYEPGVFDVRGPVPRPTALAGVVRDLAAGRRPQHPALAGPGWWHAEPQRRAA
jgi:dTDP-4-dehydrorhamnose reductase